MSHMTALESLTELRAGTPLLVGGNRQVTITPALADAFRPGDSLAVVETAGSAVVLHIVSSERLLAEHAVTRAVSAFAAMSSVQDAQVSTFFRLFAENLANDAIWSRIEEVNVVDVANAKSRGRSTTRLEASAKLRQNMIDGLRTWAEAPSRRGQVLETVQHETWTAELVAAELGVVAFVFEGRPNVVADATGVLRGGNTVVFRIGRDALSTAKAMLTHALEPALEAAGLPAGAVSLIDSPAHAAGWAMFMDRRLSLAVARGSGPAVHTLGTLARSAGVPVSLHGTGGAWIVASKDADAVQLQRAVFDSLDRKVCNTMNTCCIPEAAAATLVPAFLRGLELAAERRKHAYKLHVAAGSERWVPAHLFEHSVTVGRAEGLVTEMQAETIDLNALGHEWEWEDSPEVTLAIVDDLDRAIDLFNAQSPQFVASLLSPHAAEHEHFYSRVNAPFVGDGLTRWVDGQFALKRPELGLSNWERGRLFGRGGILSGDSVYTVRTRYRSKS
jgi:glutamate-5-semialdehyde dehydrogenase